MNRAILSSAIEGAVSAVGYHFQELPKSLYPVVLPVASTATLIEPEFCRMEGRKHGRITYSVTLHLDCVGIKLSPEERTLALEQMEQQMVDIFLLLSRHQRIAAIEELSIEAADRINERGSLSMVATAEVATIF